MAIINGTGIGETISDTSGDDTITAQAGDDVIIMSQGGTDIVDGGADNDRLVLDARLLGGSITLAAPTSSADGLSGNASWTGAAVSFQHIENFTIFSSAGSFSDNVTTGAGDDIFYHYGIDNTTYAADTIDLGGGSNDLLVADFSALTTHNVVGYLDFTPGHNLLTVNNFTKIDFTNVERLHLIGGALLDNVTGLSGDDILEGRGGNDFLDGAAGNDLLDGGTGDDTLTGGVGNDTFVIVNGNDNAAGGADSDTLIVNYGDAVTALSTNGGPTANAGLGGYDGQYTIDATRRVAYSSIDQFDITSGSGNDTITTAGGDDIVHAGSGDDLVNVGSGLDNADGGIGTDRISADLSAATGDVSWDLQANIYSGPNGTGFTNFEYFGTVRTGSGNDNVVTADIQQDETIDVGGGDNTVTVRNGRDDVTAGAGADTLIVDYSNATTNVSSLGAAPPAGPQPTANGFDGYFGDLTNRFVNYHGFDSFDVRTGSGDDIITMGIGAAAVTNDIVSLGSGNDVVVLGRGIDVADGGIGIDGIEADLSQASDAISIDLNANSYSGPLGTSFTNFEYFSERDIGFATGSGNDIVVTRNADLDDSVRLGNGDDSVKVYDGTDFVVGYGLDTSSGQGGNDTLVVDYSAATNAITTNGSFLQSQSEGWDGRLTDGGSRFVFFYGFDGFDITTGSGNDILNYFNLTSSANNVFHLGGGNDSVNLSQSTGANFIDGGTGNDTMTGGFGNDTYVVDSASDVINDFFGGVDTVQTSLASYTLATDLENLTGLGNVNQSLNGNSAANVIDGGLGADLMTGGLGNDIYVVDNVGDQVVEGAGGGSGTDEVRTSLASYTLGANVENLTGTANAGQQLIGNAGANLIIAGDGNDALTGAAGDDALFGGLGTDSAAFSGNRADYIVIDNGNGSYSVTDTRIGADGTDTITDIEYLTFQDGTFALLSFFNTAPTLTGLEMQVTFTEDSANAAPQLLDSDVTFDDAEGNFDGGHLTLAGLLAEDLVAIRNEGNGAGEIGVSGSNVSYGGVVIGTYIGGAGNPLDVTFNASATSAAIDALIQNLTYQNLSDTPTADRTFTVNVVDSAGAETASFGALDVSSLAAIDVGDRSVPTLGDYNGDGYVDLVIGNASGPTSISLFQGQADGSFIAQSGAANPFNGVYFGNLAAPALGDFNNDGKIDLLVAVDSGPYRAFAGDGAGGFTELTGGANPFGGIGGDFDATPTFADINGDGDADLVVGRYSGDFRVFDNNGGVFTELSGAANPLNGLTAGSSHAKPAFVDVDRDGDLDLVSGRFDGTFVVFRNDGAGKPFVALTGAANPLAGFNAGGLFSAPAFADVNGDGVADLISGNGDGTLATLRGVAGVEIVVTVTAQDDAAIARDDAVSTDEATILAGNVFADNGAGADSDVDGPTLDVAAVNGSAGNVGTQITLASGALLTLNADGTFSYDPNHAFDTTPAAGSGASNTPSHDSFTYTLTGGGTATVSVTINGIDTNDVLIGTAGADLLDGGVGADQMSGLTGNDIYIVDNAGDVVNEFAGEGLDTIFTSVSYAIGDRVERIGVNGFGTTYAIDLTGNALDNEMWGNDGRNVLDGRGGADIMQGFGGDDIYIVDNVGDQLLETSGLDTVFTSIGYTLGDGLERLGVNGFTTTYDIDLTGNGADNEMWGNDGRNILDGRGGADIMQGFGGDDLYIVDNGGDVVIDTSGLDTIFTSIDYTLGTSIERLGVNGFTTTYAIDLTGNALDNEMWGNDGANVIDGGAGADIMQGFGGDDRYIVDNVGDVVIDTSGLDTVFTSVSYTLGNGVERLGVNGVGTTNAVNLTGNELANEIWGNDGANVIDGRLGADILVGNGGADTFAFTTALGGGNVDQVAGFQTGVDKIALDDAIFTGLTTGSLDPAAFRIGSAAQDADDRIIYDSATGALYFDADGNGAGAAVQFANLHEGLPLTASDFSVI